MNFDEFQEKNKKRCELIFHKIRYSTKKPSEPYFIEDWALAICGEAGELANLTKKIRRGSILLDSEVDGISTRKRLAYELADIITYCDLMMTALGHNTGKIVNEKFNIVSQREMYREKLK